MNIHIEDIVSGYRVSVVHDDNKPSTKRITEINLGNIYNIVGPLYSKQQNMLNKVCTVIEFIEDRSGFPSKAKVRYVDNNRVGRVSLYNLASASSVHENF
ncbi:hypothetical protein [Paenibacillus sp. 1781tsa1]|uniref:hypothetical protein n=1 Tax=Paenibacillus sp. 1781tsa1 TaxID=2953810 RepID=UPI00209DCA25|nr:hypothetical protein [Paenibacillus sp. 1781tsa1]MCP1185036.1 hypothetical protein [Paenibacillus sp. 1781tsa1]